MSNVEGVHIMDTPRIDLEHCSHRGSGKRIQIPSALSPVARLLCCVSGRVDVMILEMVSLT